METMFRRIHLLLSLLALNHTHSLVFTTMTRRNSLVLIRSKPQSPQSGDVDEDWMDEIKWRVQRSRLSHYNSLEVLRRKRLFLPFAEARKWAQAMGAWTSKDEWMDWLSSGEKRNPYIPNRPDKYYADEWKGWSNFLVGTPATEDDELPPGDDRDDT